MTKGSAPSLNVTVDPATNRITNPGMSYDANGNLTAMPGRTMTYDTDNRMIAASGNFSYVYDPAGQRVRKNSEVIFYGVEGNLLATSAGGYNVYFGKKLIYNSTAAVVTDRLGSVVKIDSSRQPATPPTATSPRPPSRTAPSSPPISATEPPLSTTPSSATTAPWEGSRPRPVQGLRRPRRPPIGTATPTSKMTR